LFDLDILSVLFLKLPPFFFVVATRMKIHILTRLLERVCRVL
jgi:hypothetical protein